MPRNYGNYNFEKGNEKDAYDPATMQRIEWFKRLSKFTIPSYYLELTGWLKDHDVREIKDKEGQVQYESQQGTIIAFRKPKDAPEWAKFVDILEELDQILIGGANASDRIKKCLEILQLPDEPPKVESWKNVTLENILKGQSGHLYSSPKLKEAALFHLRRAQYDARNLYVPLDTFAKANAFFTTLLISSATISQEQLEFHPQRTEQKFTVGIDADTLQAMKEMDDQ